MPLSRKLKFGDRAQINALQETELAIEEQEIETGIKVRVPAKEFTVEFRVVASVSRRIFAKDEKQAKRIANKIDICDEEVDHIFEHEVASICLR